MFSEDLFTFWNLIPIINWLTCGVSASLSRLSVCVSSPVMEVPTDTPLPEEQARLHFRDVILGIEYRKYFV